MFPTFEVVPAVDVEDGEVVQLVSGERGTETTYGDPIDAATRWVEAGARTLHLIDLDGAFEGERHNAEAIAAVVDAVGDAVDVQVGGGIRTATDAIDLLDRGVDRIHSSHRLRLKLAVVSLKLDYETITELQPKDLSLSFHHWAGDLRGMEGRWVIRQMGDTRCAAFHSLTVDFREAGLIARKALQVEPSLNAALQASTVVMTLEALKKYFE